MLNRQRILVVDDEPIVNESCRRVLGADGYEVDTMPDLDGMDLLRALREECPTTPALVITGYGTVPSAVAAIRLGVLDYIEKPFTPSRLTEAVHEALADQEDEEEKVEVDAELVRRVLRRASTEPDFGSRLLYQGSRVLSGFALNAETKAAIASGDITWIDKHCGGLSPEERDWLERRLQAEIW